MILKLKRTPALFLVGFMGAGKSTVGRALARNLGWRFADLDEDIESREQLPIAQIFEERGEEAFRLAESAALLRRIHDVSRGVPWVVAVGGGCFTRSENIDLIQNHGVSIWIDAPLELIRARVASHSHRPWPAIRSASRNSSSSAARTTSARTIASASPPAVPTLPSKRSSLSRSSSFALCALAVPPRQSSAGGDRLQG